MGKTRWWVHGLNTQSPWNFVRDLISQDYSRFHPIPWFIGEYGGNGQDEDVIRRDLESMQAHALGNEAFLGAAFFQFQTTYWKGGAEMNFGLFGLGEEKIGETGEVCELGCRTWPVHCLTTDLSWLPGSKANRARAVAVAWGGLIDHASLCSSERRLSAATIGTKFACQIRTGPDNRGAGSIAVALSTAAFSSQISSSTRELLGDDSDALRGELSLTGAAAWSAEGTPGRGGSEAEFRRSWALRAAVGVAVVLLIVALCIAISRRGKHHGRLAEFAAEQPV